MRVKVSANPPLPPVRAWFPLVLPSVRSISSFKSHLCTTLPAFRGVSPSSLRLSIDGFELLDHSELTVVRDGDLVCVDVLEEATARDQHATQKPASRKRKRRMSTPSSSSSESETTSASESESQSESESDETDSETTDSESTSDSDDSSRARTPSLRKAEAPRNHRARAQPKPEVVHPSTFVPPGYGKRQTRSRNLRRRLKRMHERESPAVSRGGPVSGANAVDSQVEVNGREDAYAGLLSLSLRNKNKAKNFKSLLGRPLAPKIIFGEQETTKPPPRLIPPSSRSSLPANLFVTSIDVEAGLQREKKKKKHVEYSGDISLDYGEEVNKTTDLEAVVDRDWAALEKLTSEKQITRGMMVGYKGLGINPATRTPEECLTVGQVVSCDGEGVVVRPLRAREQVSFSGPVAEEDGAEEVHTWEDILTGDWRLTSSPGIDSPGFARGGHY